MVVFKISKVWLFSFFAYAMIIFHFGWRFTKFVHFSVSFLYFFFFFLWTSTKYNGILAAFSFSFLFALALAQEPAESRLLQ